MLTGIAGSALVTSVIFLVFMKTGDANIENSSVEKVDNTSKTDNVMVIADSADEELKNEVVLNEAPKEIIRYVEVPVYIERESPNIAKTTNEEYLENEANQPKRKKYKAISPSSIFASNDIYSNAFSNEEFIKPNANNEIQNTFTPKQIEVTPIDLGGDNSLYDRFAIEIRGAEYFNMQQTSVSQSSQPRFENVSFALMYNINDKFALGIETRQEFFYQDYTGLDNGSNWNYMQYTNYMSGSINARIKLFEFYGVRSIGQLGIGFANPGPIGRSFLGFEYNPIGNIGLVLGIEGSVLAYHHNKSYFYSPKLGVHYGIKINL